MILGLSSEAFLLFHVIVSMVGIFAGFVVLGSMYASVQLPGWTALFLLATILTSVTGFFFPITVFTPALGVGILSILLLGLCVIALYGYRLVGRWRTVYVTTAVAALYLNVFVFLVQSFQKVPFLQPLAPTQGEPPFIWAQSALLVAFVIMGTLALRAFHPERRPVLV